MCCVSPALYQLALFFALAKHVLVGACITQSCYFAKYPDSDVHVTISVSSASDCEALLDADASYEAATYVKETGSCKISLSSDSMSYTSEEQVTYRKTCNTGCPKFALNRSSLQRVTASASQTTTRSSGECVAQCADTTNCAMTNTAWGQCSLYTTCGTGCSTSFSFFDTAHRLFCYTTLDCGLDPTVVANGGLIYSDGLTSQGSEIAYQCDTGYVEANDNKHTCLNSASWSTSTFTCNPIDCGIPDDPANGMAVYSATTYGEQATFQCDSGYELSSSATVTCRSNGNWGWSYPSCNAINCGSLTAPSGGYVSAPSTTYNQQATYSCNTGYNLNGVSVRTCGSDGNWGGTAPTCSIADCGTLATISHGSVSAPVTTYNSQATYTCNTGYSLNGVSVRTCESDGNWDGTAPTCSIADCGTLATISHGTVSAPVTTYNNQATYSCNTGYNLNGVSVRTCGSDGNWGGTAPTCSIADCGTLATISYGTISVPITTYNNQATYSCNTGYNLNGVSVRTCGADGNWGGTAPTCIIVDCGILATISDGTVSAPVTTYNNQATYTCNEGYEMSGTSTRTCGSSGSWNGSPPTCSIIDCGIPSSPDNGSVNAPLTTFNSQASYSCDAGFDIEGVSIRTCNSSGVWNDTAPTCEIIDCGVLAFLTYGTIHAPVTIINSQATYTCNTGYNLNGVSVRTCGADGNWGGTAPTCIIVDCGILATISDGTVSAPVTTFNNQATYTCNEGYEMSGTSTRTCGSSGSWSGSPPMCSIIDCGIPSSPVKGSVNAPLTTFNSQASYSCDTGFDIVGVSIRTCNSSGVWNDTAPTCEIVDCGALATLAHGTISAPVTTYNSQATYTCIVGYEMSGTATRTCETAGSWSGSPPTCTIKDCGIPSSPVNGNVSFGLTTYNSTVVYTCILGYSLSGPEIRTCMSSGSWSDYSPTCSRINCSTLTAPDSGEVNFTSVFYNSTATYSCNIGYELTGVNSRTCNLSGLWDNEEPVCNIVDCGSISNQPFGTVSTDNGTTFGEVAAYSCLDGYDLVGDDRRTCLSDHTWNGSEPLCEAKDCGPLTPPTNGNLSTPDGTTYSNIANYSCSIGYTIYGVSSRNCQSNGTWSDTEPSCVETDCGAPLGPTNGMVDTAGGTLYNSVALYTCATSYTLHGVPTRICQSEGLWSDSQPTCMIPDEKIYIAPCICYKNKTFTNLSQEEIIAYLIATTAIDVKNTSSFRDRLQSRTDNRASAAALGALAVSFLAIIGGLMIAVDSIRVFSHFFQKEQLHLSEKT